MEKRGGDGSVAEVATAVAEFECTFAEIPRENLYSCECDVIMVITVIEESNNFVSGFRENLFVEMQSCFTPLTIFPLPFSQVIPVPSVVPLYGN